jgi:hypothetical protein
VIINQRINSIVKINSCAVVYIKCPNCNRWGKIVVSKHTYKICHYDKKLCGLSNYQGILKFAEAEHTKYCKKKLYDMKDSMRHEITGYEKLQGIKSDNVFGNFNTATKRMRAC